MRRTLSSVRSDWIRLRSGSGSETISRAGHQRFSHSGRLGIMKTGDFQMPFFGENYFAAATSLTGLRRAGHSIWLRASTTALLSLVSSVSAGITSSRHDAHLDKLRPNASHRLRDPCRGASVHRRQPEFRGRDSEPAARRQKSARSADWLNQNGAAPLEMSQGSNSLPRPNARRGAEN
jgi:hypothetical protein